MFETIKSPNQTQVKHLPEIPRIFGNVIAMSIPKVDFLQELNTPGDPWKQLTSRFPRLGSHDSYVSRVEYRAMAKGSPLPQDKGLGAEML